MFNELLAKIFDHGYLIPNPVDYGEMFSSALDNFQFLPAPLIKANRLYASHLEKLQEWQFSNLRFYANLGLAQVKAASEISNFQALETFFNNQHEIFNDVHQKIISNARELSDLSTDFQAALEELVTNPNEVTTPAA